MTVVQFPQVKIKMASPQCCTFTTTEAMKRPALHPHKSPRGRDRKDVEQVKLVLCFNST